MSTIVENATRAPENAFPAGWNLADLRSRLGDIPLDLIRLNPPLGCATVEDVQRIQKQEGRLFEKADRARPVFEASDSEEAT